MIQTESRKGLACLYQPRNCQHETGFCQDCQIYIDYLGHERTMGRVGSLTHRWVEREKEQVDKLARLTIQIERLRKDAFDESAYGSREKKLAFQAMVSSFNIVLGLIDKEVIK